MKAKVYLSKVNTIIGRIPVLSNGQKTRRPLQIYAAYRTVNDCNESIFFIIRSKDAIALHAAGYSIKSMVLNTGYYPRFIDYNNGNGLQLEQTWY